MNTDLYKENTIITITKEEFRKYAPLGLVLKSESGTILLYKNNEFIYKRSHGIESVMQGAWDTLCDGISKLTVINSPSPIRKWEV